MRHAERPREAGGDRLGVETQREPDRGRGEGVVDAVPAERRNARIGGAARQASEKRIPASPSDSTSAAVTSRRARSRSADAQLRAAAVGHARDPLIIGVEHGGAADGQRLDQLALAALDGLDRSGAREVRRPHRGHDADPRLRQLGQDRDVARLVHAHLEHGHLVVRRQAQQGQRQTDLVVLVGRVAQHVPALSEHLRRSAPWSRSWRASR